MSHALATPELVHRHAIECLGNLREPNFRQVARILKQGPGRLLTDLARHDQVEDLTEPNTDSGFFLDLTSKRERLLCAISAVGPFWSVARFKNQSASNKSVLWDLAPLGFSDASVQRLWPVIGHSTFYCEADVLSSKTEFDVYENGADPVPLYKVVFAFGQDLPWWA